MLTTEILQIERLAVNLVHGGATVGHCADLVGIRLLPPVKRCGDIHGHEYLSDKLSVIRACFTQLCRKCEEVKTACCDTIDRIIYDLKETNFNPYIKQTRITRVEIYRNASEEQPIDTFETTDTKSYSAKALAVASAAAALLVIASNGIVKRFLK